MNPAIQDKRAYWKVRPGAGYPWAVCADKADAIDMVTDGDAKAEYEIEETWMTPAEFEAIGEFGGW